MAIVPTIDLVDRPQSHGYDGSIDNILIRLAVTPQTPLEDVTAEASPPRIDTAEGAEDMRDEVGQRYSRSNLSGGAGLDFMHRRDRPADAGARYWDSRGVDVFGTDRGDIYDARLMHVVQQEEIDAGVVDVCQIDGTVYYLNATGVQELDVGQKVAIAGGTQMIAMGNSLYVLSSAGIDRFTPATWTAENQTATVYDKMWAVKSRILALLTTDLYQVNFGVADAVLDSVPTTESITDVVDVGPAVMWFSTTGTVHFLALDQSLDLVPTGESPFIDEIPFMATETFGIIGLVTTQITEAGGRVVRFYTAALTVSGNYDLSDLQLIYQVGDRDSTTDHAPQAIYATRDSIYVAVREADETATTLWRYYTPTGGYARAHEIDTGSLDDVSSFLEVDDRTYLAVPGDGLWREDDDYVVNGYAISPLADFFTSEEKQWVGADLSGIALPYGTSLELYDTVNPELINLPDDTSWALVTKLLEGQVSNNINDLAGRSSRYHAAMVVLRSDSSRTFTPGLQSFSFRALPNPDRDVLLRIPVNVSDQIESPGRRAVTVPGRGEAIEQALRAFEGQHVLVELYRPNLQVRGLIERFETTTETIPAFGSVRKVMYARIRGTRLEDSEAIVVTTLGASLGHDTLGMIAMGEGEINA